MRIKSAEFVISVADSAKLPHFGAPEIAFAGKSNSGKSSFINFLTGNGKLARTSSEPGRTRLINYFSVNGGEPRARQKANRRSGDGSPKATSKAAKTSKMSFCSSMSATIRRRTTRCSPVTSTRKISRSRSSRPNATSSRGRSRRLVAAP